MRWLRWSVGVRPPGYGFIPSRSEVPLIANPIQKDLSTMTAHRVQAHLMGDQACVFRGAAEFSRDTDYVLLAVAHYPQHRTAPLPGHAGFWLRESRTPKFPIGALRPGYCGASWDIPRRQQEGLGP